MSFGLIAPAGNSCCWVEEGGRQADFLFSQKEKKDKFEI